MRITTFWITISALLVGAGWILSAIHELNLAGYVVFLVAMGAVLWWKKPLWTGPHAPAHRSRKFWKRFKRPLPLLFLLILLLDLASGLCWRPDNGDSNAYRIPRVFHWLGSGGWHWIHTGDSRMNIAGCGYEWLVAPLILITGTDRWIFIPNLLAYALLPGLVFSVLRQLRVNSRVAWWWMWILSSGWCYVFQAASTLTDSIGVIYALAAVNFALRARTSQRCEDVWISMLAAGLLTGLKQTNLPMLLPWLVAVWPVAHLLLKRPVVSSVVSGFSALVSFVPMAYLNWQHAGTWTGFPKEATAEFWAWGQHQELTSPFWGVIGNIFCMTTQNLVPLFFPKAEAWNDAMVRFVHTPLGSHFAQFEVFGRLGRSVSEATAGIGLGIIGLSLISIAAARFFRNASATNNGRKSEWSICLLYLAPWIALLVFMAKVGTYQNARQAAPYYILLFPIFLAGARQAQVVRRRWWQLCAVALLAVTLAYLGFMRGRTLVPVAMADRWHQAHPNNKLLSTMMDFYNARRSVEAQRNQLEKSIPDSEKIVGYATTVGGAEPGLWQPFGRRKVERVLSNDTADGLLKAGIHYVLVDQVAVQSLGQTITDWTSRNHATLVDELTFTKDPGGPPGHLYLVLLSPKSS